MNQSPSSPRSEFSLSFFLAIVVIVAFFVIVPLMAHCQVDIVPSRPDQSYIVLGRGLKWGVSGSGSGDCSIATSACGANNNFVFPVQFPQEQIAITIFNSSNQTKNFTLTVTATNDTAVTQFQGNTSRWAAPVTPFCSVTSQLSSCSPVNILGNSYAFLYFQTAGASRVAIIISNSLVGNGSGGADLIVSQAQTQSAPLTPGSIVSSNSTIPLNTVSGLAAVSASGLPLVYVPGTQGTPSTAGPLGVANYLSDITLNEFDSWASDRDLTDSFSGGGGGSLGSSASMFFNGTNWSKAKSQSSANSSTSATPGAMLPGVLLVQPPADWTVPVQATTASNCSASQALQAGFRHCATGVQACIAATAAQTQLFVNLRDGATGAGTVKWNAVLGAQGATGGAECIVHEFEGGPICGTAGTAMTLELSAATAATNGCALTLKGYDIQ